MRLLRARDDPRARLHAVLVTRARGSVQHREHDCVLENRRRVSQTYPGNVGCLVDFNSFNGDDGFQSCADAHRAG